MNEVALKILLADDHPLFREGVKPVLQKLGPGVKLVEAVDYPTAFEATRKHRNDLDLALLDLYMPGMAGVEGVIRFRAAFPDVPVVVLSAAEQVDDIHKLLAAGALGYITKSSPRDVILAAIKRVLGGGVYLPQYLLGENYEPPEPQHPSLTTRQIEVLRELARGRNNRQIADSLDITPGTVKIHLTAAFKVLKVANRTEALLVIQKMGLGK